MSVIAEVNKRIAGKDIAASQLPEFVRAQFPTFVAFVEAYYEWLDTQQVDYKKLRDIDETLVDFIKYFKAEIAHNYPIVSSNYDTERFLLKHIKDQYLAKGSEASYKLLFRLLFGKDVYMDYPGQKMLRVSDGKWTQDVSLFVKVNQGNAMDMIGKTIVIQTSKKIYNTAVVSGVDSANIITANIENVLPFDKTNNIYELFLDRNFYGSISPGDSVKFESQFQGEILKNTNRVKIQNPGEGFRPGMVFQVSSGEGTPIWFKVLNTYDNGGLKTIDVIKFALGYSTDFSITVLPSSAVSSKKKIGQQPVAITYSLDEGTMGYVNMISGGHGYTLPPIVTLGGVGGTGATGHSVIHSGVVTSTFVSDNGQQYTYIPPITFSAPPPGGVTATGVAELGTGSLSDKVVSINITNGGYGYTTAPTITIGGDGNGAVASCGIENGVVTAVIVDTIGKNYNTAFVNFSNAVGDTTGVGASGEVILGQKYSYTYSDKTNGFTESGYINWGDYWAAEYSDGAYVGTVARQFFVNAKDTVSGNPALLNVSLGAVAKYPGYYKNNDGFLDDSMFIQDSYYYQAFAYVLKIDEQLQSYASIVRSMLHPSGMAMFGEYSINNKINLELALTSLVKSLGVTLYDSVSEITDNYWYFNIGKDLSDSLNSYNYDSYYRFDIFKYLEDSATILDPNIETLFVIGKYFGFTTDIVNQQVLPEDLFVQTFTKAVLDTDAVVTMLNPTTDFTEVFTKKILDTDSVVTVPDNTNGNTGAALDVALNSDGTNTLFQDALNAATFGNTGYVVIEPYEEGGYFAEVYANGYASTW